MKKEKLIAKRVAKNMSQNQVAKLLFMEQSTYSRRESGDTRITKEEWAKLAEILECNIEDIYEPDNYNQIKIDTRNSTFHDSSGNNNSYQNIPSSVLENLQDFITYLKEENKTLKLENKQLKKQSNLK